MLNKLTIAYDHTDPESWIVFETDNVFKTLKEQFPKWPANARIFHNDCSVENDVTPSDEASAENLKTLQGEFTVILFPGWVALPYIFAAVLAIASYILAPTAKPLPVVAQRNSNASSPNNELSDRTNRARINGRIPDIFGMVYSTPDLIAAPYKVFENNREVEYAYMCVGRGSYSIDALDVYDGETRAVSIAGTSIEVYAPYTSPNSGDEPQLRIGDRINSRVLNTKRSNSVSGQVLRRPSSETVTGANNIRFVSPNIIEAAPAFSTNFSEKFSSGDILTVANASVSSGPATKTEVFNLGFMGKQTTATSMALDLAPNYATYVTQKTAQVNSYKAGSLAPFFPNPTSYYIVEEGSLIFTVNGPTPVAGFGVGDTITISCNNPHFNGNDGWAPFDVDIDGTYEIESVRFMEMLYPTNETLMIVKLVNPQLVNTSWTDTPWIPYSGIHGYGQSLMFHIFNNPSGSKDSNDQTKYFNVTSSNTISEDYDLSETYTILAVTDKTITLRDPVIVNSDWSILTSNSPFISPTLSTSGSKWVGPYVLDSSDTSAIYMNFVAPQGLYTDDGTTQTGLTVLIQIEIQPIDEDDNPIGVKQLAATSVTGSNVLKEYIGVTLKITLNTIGRCSVRASNFGFSTGPSANIIAEEVRWRDLYSVSAVQQLHFGNITTIASVTLATASSLVIKDRKVNLKSTRMIPQRIGTTSTFTETLTASNDTADIFCAVCLDSYIGRRRLSELDVANIYSTLAEVETYFGHPCARQFNYTFDHDNFSFEETANAIADAAFCIPYRRGSLFKLNFEKATLDSTLLFNHRNKLPNSETRALTFGSSNDNDGVEYQYASPSDGSIVTIFLPEGYASVNPKKVESVGVQHHLLAYFHIWRIWNRTRYQREGIQFDATDEANLLIKNDRILVSDGTRPYSQEGEVVSVNTLTLTLSKPVDFTVYTTYSIWLQHYDGIAENIAITAGAQSNQVVLANAPRLTLVTDPDRYARTTYIIVGDTQPHSMAFLVTERLPAEKMTSTVKAVNYDARYYQNDTDYIDEVIDENGYGDSGGFEPGSGTGFLVLPAAPVIEIVSLTATTFDMQWPLPDKGTWPILRYDIYYNGILSDSYPFVEGMNPIEFNSADLAAGNYEVTVRTVDDHGNQSALSNTLTFDIAGELNQVLYRESSRQSFAGIVSGDEISISYTQASDSETEGTLAIFALYVRSTSLIGPPITVEYAEVPGTQIEWVGTFSGGFWHNLGVWQFDLLGAPFETSNFNVIFETGEVADGSAYRVTAQVIENADIGPPGIVSSTTGTSRTLPSIDITAGDLLMVFGVIDATTDFVGSFQSISGLYEQTDKVNSTHLSGVRLITSHSEYTVDAADEVIREWVGQANGFDEPEFEFMPGIALAFTPLNSLNTFVLVAGGNTAANLGFGESVASPTGSIIGNPFANLTPGQTLTLNEFYMNVGDTSFIVEITGSTSLPADNVFSQITFVDENSNNIVLDSGYIESITNLGGNRKRWIYTSPVLEPMFAVGFSYTITIS